MKKTIEVNMDKGYELDEVINDRIDCGDKWAELGWFEDFTPENGHFYYFSSYYGSDGGYYNEDKDLLVPSWDIEDMDENDFIEAYGANKDKIVDDSYFVEYPINRELSGLHVEYDYHRYKELVEMWGEKRAQEFCARYYSSLPLIIRDEDGRSYDDGRGIYQYINGQFYEVELVEVEA